MAGISPPLIQLTCRLEVQRNEKPLLSNAWRKAQFSLCVRLESHSLALYFAPTGKAALFPKPRFFPSKFFAANISQKYTKYLKDGKITLSLANYDPESLPDFTCFRFPATVTDVLVYDAAPDALYGLLQCLSGRGVGKRDLTHNEAAIQKRQKVGSEASLESLTFPLISVILRMTGEAMGRFRGVSRWFQRSIDEHTEWLTVVRGKEAPEDVVCRLIGRKARLVGLSLEGCGGVAISGVKNIGNRALRSLKTLILKDCSRVSDSAVVYFINAAPLLTTLDVSGCRLLTDTLLQRFSPPSTLPELRQISMSYFSPSALSNFLRNYPRLDAVRLDKVAITTDLLRSLQSLPRLLSLSITYTTVAEVSDLPVWSSEKLQSLTLISAENFLRTNSGLAKVWNSVGNCALVEVGCELPLSQLSHLIKSTVKTLTAACLPSELFPQLQDFTVYTDGYDLADCVSAPGQACWLPPLRRLKVYLRCDFQQLTITTAMQQRFPQISYSVSVVPAR